MLENNLTFKPQFKQETGVTLTALNKISTLLTRIVREYNQENEIGWSESKAVYFSSIYHLVNHVGLDLKPRHVHVPKSSGQEEITSSNKMKFMKRLKWYFYKIMNFDFDNIATQEINRIVTTYTSNLYLDSEITLRIVEDPNDWYQEYEVEAGSCLFGSHMGDRYAMHDLGIFRVEMLDDNNNMIGRFLAYEDRDTYVFMNGYVDDTSYDFDADTSDIADMFARTFGYKTEHKKVKTYLQINSGTAWVLYQGDEIDLDVLGDDDKLDFKGINDYITRECEDCGEYFVIGVDYGCGDNHCSECFDESYICEYCGDYESSTVDGICDYCGTYCDACGNKVANDDLKEDNICDDCCENCNCVTCDKEIEPHRYHHVSENCRECEAV